MLRRFGLTILIVGGVAFFGGLFWLSTRERLLRRRRLSQVSNAHQLLALMPDEMADVAAELYRLQGYVITENKRPDLPDGGVDFEVAQRGKTWLVQVKHWRQEVTVKEARELWGIVASEGAAGGILIGTSGFTAATREFASGKDLTLLDGPEFMTLRSQLAQIDKSRIGASDPLVSDGFALHLAAAHGGRASIEHTTRNGQILRLNVRQHHERLVGDGEALAHQNVTADAYAARHPCNCGADRW